MKTQILSLAILGLGLSLIGCAKNSQAPAKVSGAITYKGQPIKAGSMKFHTPEGTSYPATISPDGTYSATDIPTGEMVVTIETEAFNPDKKMAQNPEAQRRAKMQSKMVQQPAGGGEPPPTVHYVKIPSKYANAKTSPVTITISSGRNVKDIDLTD